MNDNDTMRVIFTHALETAGVRYACGAKQTLTADRPYFDAFGLLGEREGLYTPGDLAIIWRRLCRNELKFDLDNNFVRSLIY